ncbi:MAG: Gldg family protein [Lachnospiraceae bacterium]|nr:Gldg family protein [Lachnospiraceae bacterium]
MFAIYKRELKAYLHTVIGFLIVAANLFLIGMYFVVYNMYYDYPYFQYAISGCSILLIITIPILTMRMIAEERKNKTDQLILTAPVSVWKVVVAKYLAALSVFAIPCIVSMILPVIMSRFGSIAWGESYLSVLGYFLFGAAGIAIGTFISSLFENQIIAAAISFVALFLGYMMSSLCSLISQSGNIVTKILGFYDLSSRFDAFLNGTLDLKAVLYFVSLTVLFLFLTVQSIQKRRFSVSAKRFTLTAYSAAGIVIAIAIFVFINIGATKVNEKYTLFDLTYNKMYTLTDETKNFVSEIEDEINIYVLSGEKGYDETVSKTLRGYESLSDKIKVSYVDPQVSPRFYAKYSTKAPSSGSIIVESSLRSKVIDYNDLYEQSYSMDYTTYSTTSEVTGYDAEGQITSAIDYCLSEDMPVIYFTEGHGETALDEAYQTALSKANIEYETINLMSVESVPETAACLYINGPTGDLSEDDLNKIIAYLDGGGKVVLTLSLTDDNLTNLDKLMNYMNLDLIPGLVLEEDANHFYGSKMYQVPTIGYSDFTADVYGAGYNLFVPYNMGVKVLDESNEEISTEIFLSSTESAFLREDYTSMTTEDRKEGDVEGPFAIGVNAVKSISDGVSAEMVVYSTATMFTEAADSMVSNANRKVFVSTVGRYADKENAVSIPVKSFDLGYLSTTTMDILVAAAISMIIVPITLIVAGIVIWARRRRL